MSLTFLLVLFHLLCSFSEAKTFFNKTLVYHRLSSLVDLDLTELEHFESLRYVPALRLNAVARIFRSQLQFPLLLEDLIYLRVLQFSKHVQEDTEEIYFDSQEEEFVDGKGLFRFLQLIFKTCDSVECFAWHVIHENSNNTVISVSEISDRIASCFRYTFWESDFYMEIAGHLGVERLAEAAVVRWIATWSVYRRDSITIKEWMRYSKTLLEALRNVEIMLTEGRNNPFYRHHFFNVNELAPQFRLFQRLTESKGISRKRLNQYFSELNQASNQGLNQGLNQGVNQELRPILVDRLFIVLQSSFLSWLDMVHLWFMLGTVPHQSTSRRFWQAVLSDQSSLSAHELEYWMDESKQLCSDYWKTLSSDWIVSKLFDYLTVQTHHPIKLDKLEPKNAALLVWLIVRPTRMLPAFMNHVRSMNEIVDSEEFSIYQHFSLQN